MSEAERIAHALKHANQSYLKISTKLPADSFFSALAPSFARADITRSRFTTETLPIWGWGWLHAIYRPTTAWASTLMGTSLQSRRRNSWGRGRYCITA